MTSDFGDVVVVEFPFTDGSGSKRRPSVVLSRSDFNSRRPDVVLMSVTSRIRPDRAELEVAIEDWKSAGLQKPSVLKPVIFSLETSLVLSKLGELSDNHRNALRSLLSRVIGLSD